MTVSELSDNEYHPYYKNYIDQVEDVNIIEGLEGSFRRTLSFLKEIPSDKLTYQYAEGKWTIKEIVQHLIDSEIIFSYRALRFARNDQVSLPGFDENTYVPASLANNRSLDQLLNHYASVRQSTIALFSSFDKDMLLRVGQASESNMSVRALGFVIIGHETHHCKIIKERYLD